MDSVQDRQKNRFKVDPEDEIVISGISGRFPMSHNVLELSHNLYNKIDMVQNDYNLVNTEIPKCNGLTYDLDKFDANFFSVSKKAALGMDPQQRTIQEHAYEAVLDAGVCPKQLRGSKTGVYVGCCSAEADDYLLYNENLRDGLGVLGSTRTMLANRISFTLDLKGPSLELDTACSSAGFALDLACKAIRNGDCEAAIVGGTNIIIAEAFSIQSFRMGVLSIDGVCRPFDEKANGYVRSESVNAIFLQKRKDAKRVYATVVHSKTNVDGYKSEGITYPSSNMQIQLFKEFYDEIGIDPRTVDYIEGHCTATFVGDPVECNSVDQVFCVGRNKPLPIGTIKSNMGHSEAAASNCSLIKSILIFENEKIPANLNLTQVKQSIPSLVSGRLKPVTELTDFKGTLIGANSFGFGGANCHILLRKHDKEKVNRMIPTDNLPRVLAWSGRTEEALNTIFDSVTRQPLDTEYFALLQNTQVATLSANNYRGYAIYKQEPDSPNATCIERSIVDFDDSKRPVVWVYSGMGSQWVGMGADLMQIPIFENSVRKCHDVLAKKGIDLIKIITSDDPTTFNSILHSFIGISAIQIGLTNILKAIGLQPDYIIGHSFGELGCAYGDNCLTDEEMILASYSRGLTSIQNKTIFGSMAAVGIGYKELKSKLDDGIEIACHNSGDSCTISGPSEIVEKFVKKLKEQNIFAKEVACSNIAYHSSYIADLGPQLLDTLKPFITEAKERSEKWISTSVPKSEWNSIECKYSSAEYHTNNLLKPVLFEEGCENLPKNALTIEIAPHGLLQAIVKRTLPDGLHFSLTQRGSSEGSMLLYRTLGKLFENGVDMDLSKLYPPVQFPVSRGTPMIAPHIKWDHHDTFYIPRRRDLIVNHVVFDLTEPEFDFVSGHVIDGRNLFPATGYLYLAWKALAIQLKEDFKNLDVEFEDVRFIRACTIHKDEEQKLTVLMQPETGQFYVNEGSSTLVTGTVRRCESSTKLSEIEDVKPNENAVELDSVDFYKEIRLRGYHFKDLFRSIVSLKSDCSSGKIRWHSNWILFLDSILQTQMVLKNRSTVLPICIRKVIIKKTKHEQLMAELGENPVAESKFYPHLDIYQCGGIEIQGFKVQSVSRRPPLGIPVLESQQFVPHFPTPILSNADAGRFCVQLALENMLVEKVACVEIDMNDDREALCEHFGAAVGDLPLVRAELNYLTSREVEIPQTAVSNSELSAFSNQTFIIRSKCIFDNDFLENVKTSLSDISYIISRESKDYEIIHDYEACQGYKIIAIIPTENETLVMLQYKKVTPPIPLSIIKITNADRKYSWLETLKEKVKSEKTLIYAEKEPQCGILGLANCIRREPSGNNLRCVFIDDESAPPFDVANPFYRTQLEKDLATNVYKNGKWGSLKHFLVKVNQEALPRESSYFANVLVKGDLSSVKWLQQSNLEKSDKTVKVQYAALNFRDVMLATGKLVQNLSDAGKMCYMGFEFAGVTKDGRRVVGTQSNGCLATYVKPDDVLIWDVPDDWTLAQAVTIPIVYITVYVAFFIRTKIQKGKSVLIHSGSGGVGLAAIQVAFAYGLEVFTTVSTEEKKNYLLNEFPQLKRENIGNSRDTSFEQLIMKLTCGKGVDYVLNSLSEEKLAASDGVFLEIGKFDITNGNKISLEDFSRELAFHAISVDKLLEAPKEEKLFVKNLIDKEIKKGVIKPLKTNVFDADEIKDALRLLASGKHIGKVIVRIRENENDNASLPMSTLPRIYCNPDHTYVICGGLGGFGLELADLLVLRGCRKLVLSTRRGITESYQAYRIEGWKSYGTQVQINKSDITTREGCEQLINDASKIGTVGGIFNLAVQLRDCILENQTVETFDQCNAPKAYATKYLDEISRSSCPYLQYFVVFSSVACGRGNAGQSNYGMANSVMERIIEERHSLGLPAKAIQWGAVGDVGIVAVMKEYQIDMEIAGTLVQRISSCLEELDTLLFDNNPVNSSMVVAEKRYKGTGKGGVVEMLANVLGVKNFKSLSLDTRLADLGVDSLMSIEISKNLERDFNIMVTSKELLGLTIAQLVGNQGLNSPKVNLEMLVDSFGDESTSQVTILKLNDKLDDSNIKALILPGIEGVASQMFFDAAKDLKYPTYLLQCINAYSISNFDEMCSVLFEDVAKLYANDSEFLLIGYSFGSTIAVKMASMLENLGKSGKVILIDGSPKFIKQLVVDLIPAVNDINESVESIVFEFCLNFVFPNDSSDRKSHVLAERSWFAKTIKFIDLYTDLEGYSKEYYFKIATLLKNRLSAMHNANLANFPAIKSQMQLVKSTDATIANEDDDLGLKAHSEGVVGVTIIEGSRKSILEDQKFSELVNSIY